MNPNEKKSPKKSKEQSDELSCYKFSEFAKRGGINVMAYRKFYLKIPKSLAMKENADAE